MRTETDAREELYDLTVTARNQILSAFDAPPDSYDEHAKNVLVSNCPRNAVILLNTLADEWTHGDVVLRVGALKTGKVPVSPETFEPYADYWTYLKSHGMIHYWVEATDDTLETTFHCDASADRRFSTRSSKQTLTSYPLVDTDCPPEYIPMDDTYTLSDLSTGNCPHPLLVLWRAVWQARQRLLSEAGVTEHSSHHLDGYCHETSEALLRELNTAWNTSTDPLTPDTYPHRTDHYIQFGAITTDEHRDNDFQTRLDVERAGTDHFWVEAVDIKTDTYYILDCFSNDPDTYGQPFVKTTHPEPYTPVTDGRFSTEAVFANDSWWRPLC